VKFFTCDITLAQKRFQILDFGFSDYGCSVCAKTDISATSYSSVAGEKLTINTGSRRASSPSSQAPGFLTATCCCCDLPTRLPALVILLYPLPFCSWFWIFYWVNLRDDSPILQHILWVKVKKKRYVATNCHVFLIQNKVCLGLCVQNKVYQWRIGVWYLDPFFGG
jgi:hypothetical protein